LERVTGFHGDTVFEIPRFSWQEKRAMEIGEGTSLSALQELAKQHHLNSSGKKRNRIDPEAEETWHPLPDEAAVMHSKEMSQESDAQALHVQSALASVQPKRLPKLEAVHRRMRDGFYQQPEVIESVANRLLLLFGFGKAEN
jgi:hypothetical protein